MLQKRLIIGLVLLALGIILISAPGLESNERGALSGSIFDKVLLDYTEQFSANGEMLLGLIKDKKYDEIEKGYPGFENKMVQLAKELDQEHGALLSHAWQRTQTLGLQSKINGRRAVVAINFYNLTHERGEYTAVITNCRYFDNKQIEVLKVSFLDKLVDSDAYDDVIRSIEDSFE